MDAINVIDQLQELIRSVRTEHGIVVGGDVPHIQQGRADYQLMCQIVSEVMGTKVRHFGAFPSNPWNSGFITISDKDSEVIVLCAKRGDGRGWGFPGFGYPDEQGTTIQYNAVEEWIAETGTFPCLCDNVGEEVYFGIEAGPDDLLLGCPSEQVSFKEVRNGEERWVDSHLIVWRAMNAEYLIQRLRVTSECTEYAWKTIDDIRQMMEDGQWAFETDDLYLNVVEKYCTYWNVLQRLPIMDAHEIGVIDRYLEPKLREVAYFAVDSAAIYAQKEQEKLKKGDIQTKDDGSFVTRVDKANSDSIRQAFGVLLAHPDILYVDEECKLPKKDALPSAKYVIVVDPLDGTNNYKNGGKFNAVSVGIYKDGLLWHGAVQMIGRSLDCSPYTLSSSKTLCFTSKDTGDKEESYFDLEGLEERPILAEIMAESVYDTSVVDVSGHPCAVQAFLSLSTNDARAYLGRICLWDFAGAGYFAAQNGFVMVEPLSGQVVDMRDLEACLQVLDDDYRLKMPMLFCQRDDFPALRETLRLKDGSPLPPLEEGAFTA